MSIWNPSQYLRFAGPRLRPAIDLLGRIEIESPMVVWDLGCGPGASTRILKQRWPGATVGGVDSSPEMLDKARAEGGADVWVEGDLAHWLPPEPVDVLFSNAALHWLDDHGDLFPRLLRGLKPGGVLAVQIPRNYGAPTHTCMVDAAISGPWKGTLAPLLRPSPVAEPPFYWDVLAPCATKLDIWETEYLHVLEGNNPVVEWTRSTALRPLLDALEGEERAAFEVDYARRILEAYPPRGDGRTLMPFRRLFLVAEV